MTAIPPLRRFEEPRNTANAPDSIVSPLVVRAIKAQGRKGVAIQADSGNAAAVQESIKKAAATYPSWNNSAPYFEALSGQAA